MVPSCWLPEEPETYSPQRHLAVATTTSNGSVQKAGHGMVSEMAIAVSRSSRGTKCKFSTHHLRRTPFRCQTTKQDQSTPFAPLTTMPLQVRATGSPTTLSTPPLLGVKIKNSHTPACLSGGMASLSITTSPFQIPLVPAPPNPPPCCHSSSKTTPQQPKAQSASATSGTFLVPKAERREVASIVTLDAMKPTCRVHIGKPGSCMKMNPARQIVARWKRGLRGMAPRLR